MASLTLALPPTITGRVFAATGAKSTGSSGKSEEKGLLDFIIGALNKKDSMLEVDPLLQGPAEKKGGTTNGGSGTGGGRKGTTVVVPQKKSGGFGGLFAKK